MPLSSVTDGPFGEGFSPLWNGCPSLATLSRLPVPGEVRAGKHPLWTWTEPASSSLSLPPSAVCPELQVAGSMIERPWPRPAPGISEGLGRSPAGCSHCPCAVRPQSEERAVCGWRGRMQRSPGCTWSARVLRWLRSEPGSFWEERAEGTGIGVTHHQPQTEREVGPTPPEEGGPLSQPPLRAPSSRQKTQVLKPA